MSTDKNKKLSAKQIENWRDILCGIIGPYALIASDTEIQQMHDAFQKEINDKEEKWANLRKQGK